MALRFKIAKRKLNLGKRKGKTVYFAIQDEHPRTTWPQVERRIIQSTGISRADLRAAVIALHDIVEDELQAGRAVDLADLGSIKALAQGKMMDKFEEVNAETIRPAHVRFYPKMRLRSEGSPRTDRVRPSLPEEALRAVVTSGLSPCGLR